MKLTQDQIDRCKILINRHEKLVNEAKGIRTLIDETLGDYKTEKSLDYNQWIADADHDPVDDVNLLNDLSFVHFLTQHFDDIQETDDPKVYATHWSDNKQRWGRPNWTNMRLADLQLPFGYVIANNHEEAMKIVEKLPPLPEMVCHGAKKPDGVYLASVPVTVNARFNPDD